MLSNRKRKQFQYSDDDDDDDDFNTGLKLPLRLHGVDDCDNDVHHPGNGKHEETNRTSESWQNDKSPSITAKEVFKARNHHLTNSPNIESLAISSPSQSESRKYGIRTKSGDVVTRFPSNRENSSCWDSKEAKVKKSNIINLNPFNRMLLTSNTKYMFQRTREMVIVLNEVVTELGSSIIETYSLGTPANLKNSTNEEEIYIGRIRSSEGKLSQGTTLFEGTLESSSGHIVSLDFSQLEEYFIFPGQVLAISGMNTLGRCVQVSKLFIPRPLPFWEGGVTLNKTTGPLNVLIAAGPFTPTDSLLFEPLKDLLNIIVKTKPDVCFLIGPFLDVAHPLLVDGEILLTESFDDMFEKEVASLANGLVESGTDTQLILVASSKDAHHHPVFPTLPYETKTKYQNVLSISDPGNISIGGLIFSVTSTDILMHMSRNEFAKTTINNDRMGRLARHLITQQNFYPLYCPDESVPLDVELWESHCQMEVTPHVLIIPSDLRYFIKDVDGTVVINPERLTKGCSGGTYARLMIDIPNEAGDENEIGNGSPIVDFAIGEIIRI